MATAMFYTGQPGPLAIAALNALAAATAPRVYATFAALQAAIAAGQFTTPSDAMVTVDETNGGVRTKYFWNGLALEWVPTVTLGV